MSDLMDLAGYFDGLTEGSLRHQRCDDCDAAQFPPRAVCTHCHSPSLRWEAFPATASVFTWTVVDHTRLAAFEDLTPYAVAVLEVADLGIRIVGRIQDPPGTVTIGASCRWQIVDGPDGSPVPQWTLTEEDDNQ